MSESLRDAARTIFTQALRAVDVRAAVQSRIARRDNELRLAGRWIHRSEFDQVLVIAMGKAAAPMYLAAADAFEGFPHTAIVVGPQETLPSPDGVQDGPLCATYLPGAHPIPTAESRVAAATILPALQRVTARTVVLFLISGGASAMVEQPLDPAISLDDLAAFSLALVGSGLTITAMNTLRKHLSAVKGGRLAVVASAARMQCTLLISDVPAVSPEAIASGPSLPDGSTLLEAQSIFKTLQSTSALPRSIAAWFENRTRPETPKASHTAFDRAYWEVILSSDHLEGAAVRAAEAAGFYTVVDNTCDDWEYREAAEYLLHRSRDLAAAAGRPTCIVSVGEVGVALPPIAGEGGRNQQFALWCGRSLAARRQVATVLSAGSDGIDGHSRAAGAVCDETIAARALDDLSVNASLAG
ncbi:MAG: glycerate kinase type-2 family protein, partial [Janthinobacterium lividum]